MSQNTVKSTHSYFTLLATIPHEKVFEGTSSGQSHILFKYSISFSPPPPNYFLWRDEPCLYKLKIKTVALLNNIHKWLREPSWPLLNITGHLQTHSTWSLKKTCSIISVRSKCNFSPNEHITLKRHLNPPSIKFWTRPHSHKISPQRQCFSTKITSLLSPKHFTSSRATRIYLHNTSKSPFLGFKSLHSTLQKKTLNLMSSC